MQPSALQSIAAQDVAAATTTRVSGNASDGAPTGGVCVNTRYQLQRVTGVQRYAVEMMRRIGDSLRPIKPDARIGGGMKAHLWEQLVLPTKIGADLLWSPTTTGPLAVRDQVVTIHDVAPAEHPEWYSPNFARWYSWLVPRLARRVRRILAVSQYTKSVLVSKMNVAEDKIVVTPLGAAEHLAPVDSGRIQATLQTLGIPSAEYFIYVGSLEPRKNLSGLIRAWADAQARLSPNAWLVIVGAAGDKGVFAQGGARVDCPRVRYCGYVPDESLAALYSGAIACVYPSLYEGFGLPALEAMASGCPVITSNRASLPEVVGDAGILVDPTDIAQIGQAMIDVAFNRAFRGDLVHRAIKRSQQFSYDRCAATTLEVLLEEARNLQRRSRDSRT